MTNSQSKLYTNSTLSRSRQWSKECKFIDMDLAALKNLIKDSSNISHIATISITREIQLAYAPTFASIDDDGDAEYLIGNASNLIPSESLIKAPGSSCGFFISLAIKSSIGELAEGHGVIPSKLLFNSAYANKEVVLQLVPSVCPLPFGTAIPTGDLEDSFVVNALGKYPEHKIWLEMVRSALLNKELISTIIDELSVSLRTYLPGYKESDMNPNGPFTIFTPVCMATVEENTDLYDKLNGVRKLFQEKTSPSSSYQNMSNQQSGSHPANATGGAMLDNDTFLKMAHIIAHPEHETKKKEDELSLAIIKNLHICGKICWKTGRIIGDVSECTLAPGFLDCYKYKGNTRTQMLRNYFESGMDAADEDDLTAAITTIEQDRAMKHYTSASLLQFAKGNIEKESLESLHADGSNFDILVLAAQRDSGKIALLRKSEIARKAEEELDVPESQRSKVTTTASRVGSMSNMDDIRSLAANLVGHHNLVALAKGSLHDHVVLATEIYMKLYVVFSSSKHKQWESKMAAKQPQYYVICFKVLERIFRQLASFAQNNKNITYSIDKNMAALTRDSKIQMAVTIAFNFITELKTKMAMEDYFLPIPDITPDSANPEKLKLAKQTLAEAPVTAATSNASSSTGVADTAPKPQNPKKRKSSSGLVAVEPQKIDPKTRGFFIPSATCTPKIMFGNVNPGTNGKVPCFDHHAIGRECSHGKLCRFLHGSAVRMDKAMLASIFDDMLEHKQASFNPALKNGMFGKLVTEKYQSLWNPVETAPSTTVASQPLDHASFLLRHTMQSNNHLVDSLVKRSRIAIENQNNVDESCISLPRFRTGESDQILADYQNKYGIGFLKPIISSSQGKPTHKKPIYPSRQQLYSSSNLKPRSNAYFRVRDLTLDEVALVILHPDSRSIFSQVDLTALKLLNSLYYKLLSEYPRLESIDFSPLSQPRFGYSNQKVISEERVDMTSACFLHYKGDTGLLVRYLGHEYTGLHRDVSSTLNRIQGHVDERDFDDIKRMLTEGCPFEFDYEISKSDKTSMLIRGNQKSLDDNMELVAETMNKEEKHSHVIVMRDFLCHFGPSCWHIPQGLNLRKGKKRLISDGSTKLRHDEVVLNDITSIENEPAITFGDTKLKLCQFIYNTRISRPNEEILGAYVDVKACFRYIRIAPELAGAFGYMMKSINHYYFSPAGVFGWKGSCNVWEPFRRAIEQMTAVIFQEIDDDNTLHQELLDLITWADPPSSDTTFVSAVSDSINKGITDENGVISRIPAFMFVDDAALISIRQHMKRLLIAVIETIFIIMGRRDDSRRQCHLALDKWKLLHVAPRFIYIGLIFDTRKMTVGIPDDYRDELIALIDQPWHQAKQSFTALELQSLVGKIARIGEACKWIFHMLPHLYASIDYALSSNKKFYKTTSPSFRQMLQAIKTAKANDVSVANFAMKATARRIHHSPKRYFINESLREEILSIRQLIDPHLGVKLESPIAHMIKRDATGTGSSDACLYGGGGFSCHFRYWWHLRWCQEIFSRTIKFTSGKNVISINDLEFMSMIINYIGALVAIQVDGIGVDPHPVILLWADNQSAIRWITRFCLKSMAGRALGRFFCFLLAESNLGINAKWVAGDENTIADVISRLKQTSLDSEDISAVAGLQAVRPEQRAVVLFTAMRVDKEISNSKRVKALKTSRARQAFWIKFMTSCGLDPCMVNPALMSYLAIYCKLISEGENLTHKDDIRAETVKAYMDEINVLFRKRGLSAPINFRSKEDAVAILVSNLRKEEVIACQRDPFTPQMIAEFLRQGNHSSHESLPALMKDIIIVGRLLGFRASEISQSTLTKPDYHEYPSGTRVVKSICEDWWTGYDSTGNIITDVVKHCTQVHKMKIVWMIQKNRRNKEPLTYIRDDSNPEFCVIRAIISMITRARCLGQPSHLPLSVFRDDKGKTRYLTGKLLTDFIKEIAKIAHPTISVDALRRLSAHSIRVWACILLFEAGKKGDYIKKRLRWLSDCYRVYLRNTDSLASQHNSFLDQHAELIKAMKITGVHLPLQVDHTVPIDDQMGDYIDVIA